METESIKRNFLVGVHHVLLMVLVAGMLGVGMMKCVGSPDVVESFQNWGLPDWSRYVVGVVELIIGICLVIPVTRKYALFSLLLLMIGATGVHIIHGEYLDLIGPGFILCAVMAMLWLRDRI